MTATNADDDGSSDCDHWPDDASDLQQQQQHVAVAASGYDSHKGLRSHVYHPPSQAPAPAPSSPKYTYATAQPVAYPAYYTSGPTQPVAAPQSQLQMANYHVYQPAYSGTAAPMPPQQGNLWLGRTKAQVEEDNMKLAAKEGAYQKRKIVPTGVREDQMMWCVEGDGSHTLRTFISIKELKGEWMKYPRTEGSYYFVREAEEEEEKKED
ncbi:hypothetical protein B0A55_00416 [Friedmanniomyces simplex]|uniref:Uncharacterized protein n=1 Tax=Friedmanniomyces simplex TaxID=329884 RepID=A0A4V5NIL4_9PEZI|nr:hypothetical protein B0A55_00416 [Friedmanniomyces simplex]